MLSACFNRNWQKGLLDIFKVQERSCRNLVVRFDTKIGTEEEEEEEEKDEEERVGGGGDLIEFHSSSQLPNAFLFVLFFDQSVSSDEHWQI